MRSLLLYTLLCVCVPGAMSIAGGFSNTYSLESGTVTVSNSQANSSWVLVSVLIRYDSPGTGTVDVWRTSQEHRYTLGTCSFTNVSSIVWVPDSDYPFTRGDALVVQSSVTNGVLQVLRKGD